MAKRINKATGLNNISETWDQNERNRPESDAAHGGTQDAATGNADLDQVIREEASEYDHANKEDRVMGGDRATVNDDSDENAGDQ